MIKYRKVLVDKYGPTELLIRDWFRDLSSDLLSTFNLFIVGEIDVGVEINWDVRSSEHASP